MRPPVDESSHRKQRLSVRPVFPPSSCRSPQNHVSHAKPRNLSHLLEKRWLRSFLSLLLGISEEVLMTSCSISGVQQKQQNPLLLLP